MKHETFGERQRRRGSDLIDKVAMIVLYVVVTGGVLAAAADAIIKQG